ncbi:hypothetical protein [Brevundimonas olei]|uniref:hypothetical protein n=1 Tax=Brevundimonas olei TaxID=657642 RepID=UPI0031DC7E47
MADLNFLNRVAQNGGTIPAELRTEPEINADQDEIDRLRARITALGGKAHHKAGVDKLTEVLNALLDDTSEGLSRREINADLTALNVEFDPYGDRTELLKLRDEARAARDGGE